MGLIERTVSPLDARVHPLRLTPEGERRLARALAGLADDRTALASTLDPVLEELRRPDGTDAKPRRNRKKV